MQGARGQPATMGFSQTPQTHSSRIIESQMVQQVVLRLKGVAVISATGKALYKVSKLLFREANSSWYRRKIDIVDVRSESASTQTR